MALAPSSRADQTTINGSFGTSTTQVVTVGDKYTWVECIKVTMTLGQPRMHKDRMHKVAYSLPTGGFAYRWDYAPYFHEPLGLYEIDASLSAVRMTQAEAIAYDPNVRMGWAGLANQRTYGGAKIGLGYGGGYAGAGPLGTSYSKTVTSVGSFWAAIDDSGLQSISQVMTGVMAVTSATDFRDGDPNALPNPWGLTEMYPYGSNIYASTAVARGSWGGTSITPFCFDWTIVASKGGAVATVQDGLDTGGQYPNLRVLLPRPNDMVPEPKEWPTGKLHSYINSDNRPASGGQLHTRRANEDFRDMSGAKPVIVSHDADGKVVMVSGTPTAGQVADFAARNAAIDNEKAGWPQKNLALTFDAIPGLTGWTATQTTITTGRDVRLVTVGQGNFEGQLLTGKIDTTTFSAATPPATLLMYFYDAQGQLSTKVQPVRVAIAVQ